MFFVSLRGVGLKIALVVALALLSSGAAATAVDPSRIDAIVEGERASQKIPGVAVLIVQAGKPVVMRGYGLANVELQVPATDKTLFQTGSVGKMFTAALIMKQVEKGLIVLDAPISTYFPEAPASWKGITVRQMLNHTSGIPNYTMADYKKVMDGDEAGLGTASMALPLDFVPGSRWSYSNTAYVMLGLLVRRVTGRFYGDVLVDEVFKPLGMPTARNISEQEIIPQRADGYEMKAGTLVNQGYVPPLLNSTADGSLYMALADYRAWDRAVNAGALLSAASWAQIFKPVRLTSGRDVPYGFGWNLGFAGGQPYRGHSGSWQGFETSFEHYDRGDITIVVLANLAGAKPTAISRKLAAEIDPLLVVDLPCLGGKPEDPCSFGPGAK